MILTADVEVASRSGLHARPAATLAKLAARVSSAVTLRAGERTVNAASVLSIISAGITQGQTVTVECEGDEAERDLAEIVAAIEAGLGD
jgi:phosphotransferase system HPr (HPr) family protein